MTDWERMQERIYVFADADRRSRLSEKDLQSCPTCDEILQVMNDEN